MSTRQPSSVPVPAGLARKWFRSVWGRVILGELGLILVVIVLGFSGEGPLVALANSLMLLLLLAIAATLWIGSLVEAVAAPDWMWSETSQSKLVFVLLTIFLSLLGAILYLCIARPALRRVAVAHTNPA